jgi:hypothetical protein
MSNYRSDGLDPAAIERDEQLLSGLGELAGGEFVNGSLEAAFADTVAAHADDPVVAALTALAADVSPGSSTVSANSDGTPRPGSLDAAGACPVVDLSGTRLRRSRQLRRTAVAGVAAVVVLSVSGVAAAGTLAAHRGEPLHSVYTFFHGRSASEKAAGKVAHLEQLAADDLAADPQRLVAAAAALNNASDWLLRVDPVDLAGLPDRLIDLKSDLAAALRAAAAANDQGGLAPDSGSDGSDDSAPDHGQGPGHEGPAGPADSGDDIGSGEHVGQPGSGGGPGDGGGTSDDNSGGSSTGPGGGSGGDATGSSGGTSDGGLTGGSSGGSDDGSGTGSGDSSGGTTGGSGSDG